MVSERYTTGSADVEEFVYRVRYGEGDLRELAQRHKGQVVVGVGVRGKPRRMARLVSVRLSSELLLKAHDIADERDMSLSDVLREGLRRL